MDGWWWVRREFEVLKAENGEWHEVLFCSRAITIGLGRLTLFRSTGS